MEETVRAQVCLFCAYIHQQAGHVQYVLHLVGLLQWYFGGDLKTCHSFVVGTRNQIRKHKDKDETHIPAFLSGTEKVNGSLLADYERLPNGKGKDFGAYPVASVNILQAAIRRTQRFQRDRHSFCLVSIINRC